jgi:isopenicillin N synthase-like dioxygenase
VGGLQIYRDGSWLSVKPLTNSFILNIGDSFEVSLSLSVFHMFEEEL